jgi:hypothetical protein
MKRQLLWAIEFLITAAITLVLIWLGLRAYSPLTYFLFEFFYGEANTLVFVWKVLGFGVLIGLVALLLRAFMRAIFTHSR